MKLRSAVAPLMAATLLCRGVWATSSEELREATDERIASAPFAKVVNLLKGMAEKGISEKQAEQVAFAKVTVLCQSTIKGAEKSIKKTKFEIEQLNADIDKADADAMSFADEVAELEVSLKDMDVEVTNATAVRKNENADYTRTHQDFTESIEAIGAALRVLRERDHDIPQSLSQLRQSSYIPQNIKAAIEEFIEVGKHADTLDEVGAPDPHAYEFQSGTVLTLLEQLLLKFKDQRRKLEQGELTAKGNFDLLVEKLSDNIKNTQQFKSKKSAAKAQSMEDGAQAKGDLDIAKEALARVEKQLMDEKANCHAASIVYEQNQMVRAEEMKAIKNVIELLQGESVVNSAGRSSSAQEGASALLQLRSGGSKPDSGDLRKSLLSMLQERMHKFDSGNLGLIVAHAAVDPLGKVKEMIKELIVTLVEDANKEASHQAFCDSELATNKHTRADKQSEVEELTAKVEQTSAEVQQLGNEIKEISNEVSTMKSQQAEAMKIRSEEKANNKKNIDDAKEGQIALERAIKVLKEFMGKATGSESLVQAGSQDAQLSEDMETLVQDPYTGMQSSHSKVTSLLEAILADFARLEADTQSMEDQAQAAHEDFMRDSDKDIAVKEVEVDHKSSKREKKEAEMEDLKKDLEITQEELDAALGQYNELSPSCVDSDVSYAKRLRLRQEEISSLQDAVMMLSSERPSAPAPVKS